MKKRHQLLLTSSILSVLLGVGSVMAGGLSFTSIGVIPTSTTVNPSSLNQSGSVHMQRASTQTIAASTSTVLPAIMTQTFTSGQVTPSSTTLNCFEEGVDVCFNQVTYSQQVESSSTTMILGVANTLSQNTGTFDFSLSNGGNIVVFHGNSGSTTITATLVSGSTQPVALTCSSGLPIGAICSFPGTDYPNFQDILTISTTPATPGGLYPITVTGTSSSVTRTTTFTLTVNPPPQNPLTTGVVSGQGVASPNCPTGCQETLGTSISVNAYPASGWTFSSWTTSGASCSGGATANPCIFSMPNNAVTVTANFVINQVTVNLHLLSYKVVNVGVQILQGSTIVAARIVTLTSSRPTASILFQAVPSGPLTVKISGYSIATQTRTLTIPPPSQRVSFAFY